MSQPTKEDFQTLSRAIASLEQALRSSQTGSGVTSSKNAEVAKKRASLKRRESQTGMTMESFDTKQEKVKLSSTSPH